MNPFEQLPHKSAELILDWQAMRPAPYDKQSVDPYTRARLILMIGTEFENVWFSHQFSRNTQDNELRRRLALLRRSEQQQQKLLCHLKPMDESMLEHTIGYEQLAVDLTAHLAARVSDANVKNALDFALLEDFDHLYRYANLLDMTTQIPAQALVGRYTEIMPGRPTIAHHRHPYDSIRCPMSAARAQTMDVLAASIITAAEQQTMNYYMNIAAVYPHAPGRELYQEIGMIEEQHVSQYGSLLNPQLSFLENLLVHQYTECYLYWSCLKTESDARIRGIWDFLLNQELMHLNTAQALLKEYEGKVYEQVLPDACFPEPLRLESQIDYVRGVLKSTANQTACRESYIDADRMGPDSSFADYQRQVNRPLSSVSSHGVICAHIDKDGKDYRYETALHPVAQLRDRAHDNTQLGRPANS